MRCFRHSGSQNYFVAARSLRRCTTGPIWPSRAAEHARNCMFGVACLFSRQNSKPCTQRVPQACSEVDRVSRFLVTANPTPEANKPAISSCIHRRSYSVSLVLSVSLGVAGWVWRVCANCSPTTGFSEAGVVVALVTVAQASLGIFQEEFVSIVFLAMFFCWQWSAAPCADRSTT